MTQNNQFLDGINYTEQWQTAKQTFIVILKYLQLF